jgi:hypothetical protein
MSCPARFQPAGKEDDAGKREKIRINVRVMEVFCGYTGYMQQKIQKDNQISSQG